jgi:acetoin utilization deacetylase AcuC-like enzyme
MAYKEDLDKYSRFRDEFVFQYGIDYQTPIAFSMAGGYGKEISSTVHIHLQTIQIAFNFSQKLA